MDQARFHDRVRWGMNIAARRIGTPTDLYRPKGPLHPLAGPNRYLRMHAAFIPRQGSAYHTNSYGDPLWYGVFDAAYTKPGDYLCQDGRTLFIATQQSLVEPLCVQTNRCLTITRAIPPGDVGATAYGGLIRGSAFTLLGDWPASVLGVTGGGNPSAGLPTDTSISLWTVLMPAWPSVILQTGDLIADDLGRSAVIVAAELTELGWRLTVKQVRS